MQQNTNNTILTVARLDKQKDHFTLLKAFELLVKEIKNVQLLLVGDGPLKKELQDIVKELNIESNVEFLGWQKELDGVFLKVGYFCSIHQKRRFSLCSYPGYVIRASCCLH